mmetsp:Transcript_2623/g.6750  ORF Transcript_2623/g.6750 Transcript_2623/m.6750 type:complete len:136 (-) Transcript_2623:98-505(-)
MLKLARKLRSAVSRPNAAVAGPEPVECVQGVILDDEDLTLDGHLMEVTDDGTLLMGDLDRALGCQQEVIDNLPVEVVKTVSTFGTQTSCVICQSDYVVHASTKILPCSHRFHTECIDQWLTVSRCCPLCDKSVLA